MKENLPKVSFIIPLYNAERYIAQTLESALGQTYQNIEVIVVDDCGQDNSVNIVKQFKDDRIKLIHNKRNCGIAYSRNIALANATGEFIALLDDDDIAINTRLEKQIDFLQKHPDIGAVGGNAQWIDENGEIIRDIIDVIEDSETVKMFLHFRNLFNNSEMTFRADVVKNYAIEYSDECYGMEDFLFWVKLSKVVQIVNIPDLVLKKRVVHTNATMQTRKKNGKERKEKYFEIQKYSLSQSGFILNANDEKALKKFFDEKASVCKNIGDLKLLTAFMTRIITQAQDMHISFYESLADWFSELLEWNIENFKYSYLEEWKESTELMHCEDYKVRKKPNLDKVITTDLVKLRNMSLIYEEQEKYIQELLEAKKWLEEQYEEQKKYVKEVLEAKKWLEEQYTEQKEYIQELLKGKDWLEKHSVEQEEYIQELLRKCQTMRHRIK